MCSHLVSITVARSIQQWRAAVSVLTESQPKPGTASLGLSLVPLRKRLRCHKVGELFLFHPPAFSICIFQLSSSFTERSRLQLSPLVHSSDGKAKALCTRELHPCPGVGWTMNSSAVPVLLCPYCVCVVTGLIPSCQHPTATLPTQACLLPHRCEGFYRCLTQIV